MKITSDLIDSIDKLLPQTQCRRCGYADCHSYAEAIAAGQAGINRCPPGGSGTIETLAKLTGCAPEPLDTSLGPFVPNTVAFIDEALCIGCTKCIQTCPVDAIVGAAKQMHTIIESLCTGCELCVAPCPVDCIHMQAARDTTEGIAVPAAGQARADFFSGRYEAHNVRLVRDKSERQQRLQHQAAPAGNPDDKLAQRKLEIAAAMTRVRTRRAQRQAEQFKP